MTTRPAVITAAAVTAALEIVEALPQQQRIEVVAPPPQRFEGPPPRFDVLPPQRVEVAQTQRFEATQTQRIDAAQPRFEAAFQTQRVEIAQSRIYDSPQRFEGPPQPSRYEPPQLHRFEAPQPTHGRFETSTQPHSRFEGPPRLAEIIHRQEIPRLENFQRNEPRSAEVPVLSRQPFYPQPAGLAPVRHPYNQQTRIIVPFHPTQQSFMGQVSHRFEIVFKRARFTILFLLPVTNPPEFRSSSSIVVFIFQYGNIHLHTSGSIFINKYIFEKKLFERVKSHSHTKTNHK